MHRLPMYLCHVTSLSDHGVAVEADPKTRAVAEHADSLKTHSPHFSRPNKPVLQESGRSVSLTGSTLPDQAAADPTESALPCARQAHTATANMPTHRCSALTARSCFKSRFQILSPLEPAGDGVLTP
jgi:hypothetical protein